MSKFVLKRKVEDKGDDGDSSPHLKKAMSEDEEEEHGTRAPEGSNDDDNIPNNGNHNLDTEDFKEEACFKGSQRVSSVLSLGSEEEEQESLDPTALLALEINSSSDERKNNLGLNYVNDRNYDFEMEELSLGEVQSKNGNKEVEDGSELNLYYQPSSSWTPKSLLQDFDDCKTFEDEDRSQLSLQLRPIIKRHIEEENNISTKALKKRKKVEGVSLFPLTCDYCCQEFYSLLLLQLHIRDHKEINQDTSITLPRLTPAPRVPKGQMESEEGDQIDGIIGSQYNAKQDASSALSMQLGFNQNDTGTYCILTLPSNRSFICPFCFKCYNRNVSLIKHLDSHLVMDSFGNRRFYNPDEIMNPGFEAVEENLGLNDALEGSTTNLDVANADTNQSSINNFEDEAIQLNSINETTFQEGIPNKREWDICDEVCQDPEDFRLRLETHHGDDSSQSVFQCPHCLLHFTLIDRLYEHVSDVHNAKADSENESDVSENSPPLLVPENIMGLPCSKDLSTPSVVNSIENDDKVTTRQSTTSMPTLVKQEMNPPQPVMQFSTGIRTSEELYKTDATEYKPIHLGPRLFQCPICSQTFQMKFATSRHIDKHTKPFKCLVCGRSYSRKDHLLTHLNTHTKEGKASAPGRPTTPGPTKLVVRTASNSNRIKRTKKPSANSSSTRCHMCQRVFSSNKTLRTHLRLGRCPNMKSY